jgi:MYXO-CTERM domain-containing protein
MSGGNATASWAFRRNTDGGAMGLFANDADWTLEFSVNLANGIDEWQYYYAGGNNLTLDPNEPLTIAYRSPPSNSSWETRTIAGTQLTLCAGLESSSGNPIDYTFTWNDTPPSTETGTTTSDTEVVCSEHTFAAAGLYTLTLDADDGNGTATSEISVYVEDPTPLPVTITSPADGSLLADSSPTVDATTDPGATVELFVDGVSTATRTADSNGDVSFTAGDVGTLTDGDHAVELIASDSGGSSGMGRADFTVDTVSELTLTSPLSSPLATNDDTPAFEGTAEEGADVEIELSDGGGSTVELLTFDDVPASGDWSVVASSLTDGDYTYTVRSIDPASNEATISGTLTVDTIGELTLTTPAVSPHHAGSSEPMIGGASEPGSTVQVEVEDAQGQQLHQVMAAVDGSGAWQATLPTLTDGEYAVSATSTDALGNPGQAGPVTIIVDTAPPAVSLDSPTDQLITNETPDYLGTAEIGSDVVVTITDGSGAVAFSGAATLDASGNWTVVPGLGDGTYTIIAESTDAAGNVGASEAAAFTIDTIPPAARFTSPGNGSTSTDTTPTIEGTAELGADVEITVIDASNALVSRGAPTRGPDDTWSYQTPVLADGAYQVRLRAEDAAGNFTYAGPVNFSIDTTAPAVSLTEPSTDARTNATALTIAGTTESDAAVTVEVFDASGTVVATIAASVDAQGQFDALAENLPEGSYTVVATATDSVGNSEATAPRGFEIDRTAPAVSIVSPSAQEHTNDDTPSLQGTSEADAQITIEVTDASGNTAFTASVTADGSGQWSVTSATLPDGDYTVTATASDAAGNQASDDVDVTINTSAPSIAIIEPAAESITSDDTPIVAGSTDPGAMVSIELYDAARAMVFQADPTVEADGSWSVESTLLPAGEYTVSATATDTAGNDAQTAPRSFVINTDLPTLVVDNPTADLLTSDGLLTIDGSTDPDATIFVEIHDSSGEVAATPEAAVEGDGSFAAILESGLEEGSYAVEITAVGANGLSLSETRDVTIDMTPPEVAVGQPADDAIVGNDTPSLSGTAEPGAEILIYMDDELLGSIVADENGEWSFDVEDALSDGDHTLSISAMDEAGNQGESVEVSFTVDTQAPMVTMEGLADGEPVGDSVELTGTAEPGSEVEIWVDGELVGTATADENGEWSFELEDLEEGKHQVEARADDQAGNVGSTGTITIDVTIEPTGDVDPSDDSGSSGGQGGDTDPADDVDPANDADPADEASGEADAGASDVSGGRLGEGCGCSQSPVDGGSGWLFIVGLVALFGTRRRR